MKTFILEYLQAEFKNSFWSFFKGILLLIPILSIVGMFASVSLIPDINQRSFLKQSDYEWMYFSDEHHESEFFFQWVKADVAHLISTDGGVIYKPDYPIELFTLKERHPLALNGTYFNDNNVLSGDLDRLSTEGDNLGIALSYNAAKKVKKKVGDEAVLIFHIGGGDVVYYPVTIQSILRPMYSGDGGGVGFVYGDNRFLSFLREYHVSDQYVMFGSGERQFPPSDEVVYKQDQLTAASLNLLSDQHLVNYVLSAMGAVVVYLIVLREVKFTVNRRMRTIGILSALGASKRTIVQIFWTEQTVKLIIASLVSAVVYKYVIMERFIGEYIALNT